MASGVIRYTTTNGVFAITNSLVPSTRPGFPILGCEGIVVSTMEQIRATNALAATSSSLAMYLCNEYIS